MMGSRPHLRRLLLRVVRFLLVVLRFPRFIFRSVRARRALLPVLPPFFAAACSFFRGIGLPFFAPSDRRRLPLFFAVAFAIHFPLLFLGMKFHLLISTLWPSHHRRLRSRR